MAEPSEQFAERPLPPKTGAAGLFSERPLPGSAAPAEPASVGAARPLRFVVPLVLFVLIIGGVAWLVQNMPSWRVPKTTPTTGAPASGILLEFAATNALWEDPSLSNTEKKEDTLYAREYERGDEGKYWYPFKNITDQPVELNVVYLGCDCSRLDVALVTETEWQQVIAKLQKFNTDLEENPAWAWAPVKDKQAATVPGNGFALLRMTWNVRKDPGTNLNLQANLWASSPSAAKRQPIGIAASALIRRALETHQDRVHVGMLEPRDTGRAEYFLWSATRDDAVVEVKDPSRDELIQVKTTKLDKSECATLQTKLRKEGVKTRVRSGYRVNVTVLEQKGDKQLDQGPLHRPLEVHMQDSVGDMPTLIVAGTVRSEVQVGGPEDQGKVQLKSFQAADGIRKTVVLWSHPKHELQIAKKAPAALEVTLKKGGPPSKGGKQRWEMDVVVPPNQHFGPFSEEHAIILETQKEPPRRIRIPIVGLAGQG